LSSLQCFCFLKTKDHFSSSWASWVEGGKGHEFVVGLPGVLSRLEGVADHGVFIDSSQAGGLPDATAVLQVLEDIEGLLVGESGAKEGGAFAFGKADLAGAAGQHASLLVGTVAETDAKVASAPQAIIGAVGVLATEEVKVFHEQHRSKFSDQVDNASWEL
jgi:hypothetical protein